MARRIRRKTITKHMSTQKRKFELFARLQSLGFTYDEAARSRWVVYRRACGITRKTSLRGPAWDENLASRAWALAARLKHWPADRLAQFRF